MTTFSFEAQLQFLAELVKRANTPDRKRMVLSLTESVKTARDHNLNCPKQEIH